MVTTQIVFYYDPASTWEKALYAFFGEKQRRSGSRRSLLSNDRTRLSNRPTRHQLHCATFTCCLAMFTCNVGASRRHTWASVRMAMK